MVDMIINLKHYDCLIMEKLKDKNYPFATLHLHPEDAKWLYKRWQKYCAAASRLEAERAKEKPDVSALNGYLNDVLRHKKAICETVAPIASRASKRMLVVAFGDDIEEWMKENGFNINQIKKK